MANHKPMKGVPTTIKQGKSVRKAVTMDYPEVAVYESGWHGMEAGALLDTVFSPQGKPFAIVLLPSGHIRAKSLRWIKSTGRIIRFVYHDVQIWDGPPPLPPQLEIDFSKAVPCILAKSQPGENGTDENIS